MNCTLVVRGNPCDPSAACPLDTYMFDLANATSYTSLRRRWACGTPGSTPTSTRLGMTPMVRCVCVSVRAWVAVCCRLPGLTFSAVYLCKGNNATLTQLPKNMISLFDGLPRV